MGQTEHRQHPQLLLARRAGGGLGSAGLRRVVTVIDVDSAAEPEHLANVSGWLDDDDPFLAEIDAIVEARSSHRPRAVGKS